MNLYKLIIIVMIGFMLICCKNQTNKTTNLENLNAKESIDKENKYLINEKGVLGLFIGETMPEKLDGYKLIKSVKIVDEGDEEPIINVIEGNTEILQISFDYNSENGSFSNKIGEILIKDGKFKTKENVGIETSIDDFIRSYSNYRIWYTYISGNYVIESKDKEIQFLLDESGYIGKKNLMESDRVELVKEDFSPNTKIIAIRIFKKTAPNI